MNDEKYVRRLQVTAAMLLPCIRGTADRMGVISDRKIRGIGTNGFDVFFHPEAKRISQADHQHMIVHCLLGHPAVRIENRSMKDLSCDLAAEYVRAEIFEDESAPGSRRMIREFLPSGCDPHFAPEIARGLMELHEDELEELGNVFTHDDHRYWYEKPKELQRGKERWSAFQKRQKAGSEEELWQSFLSDQLEKEWSGASEGIEKSTGGTLKFGTTPGSREEKLILRKIGRYDFSSYLKRFSAQREEVMLDPENFDYIPYIYGLERYKNLPFLEPLEYTECSRVEELVIAIDTSGSCHKETVEKFFSEIEKMLMNHDSFFRKMNVHIIQCDSIIQDHCVIRSIEDWKLYRKNLTIKGRGGTDFTPVFALVDQIRRDGGLKRLKGLLYFTDGDGVYPQEETPYETAFVFTETKALEYNIPVWIKKLCLRQR